MIGFHLVLLMQSDTGIITRSVKLNDHEVANNVSNITSSLLCFSSESHATASNVLSFHSFASSVKMRFRRLMTSVPSPHHNHSLQSCLPIAVKPSKNSLFSARCTIRNEYECWCCPNRLQISLFCFTMAKHLCLSDDFLASIAASLHCSWERQIKFICNSWNLTFNRHPTLMQLYCNV